MTSPWNDPLAADFVQIAAMGLPLRGKDGRDQRFLADACVRQRLAVHMYTNE
jgi:hypothetical protein